MALFARANRLLPDPCSAADIARATGLTAGRISQLRGGSGPDALPEPDADGSTSARPLWEADTVARWCARTGRRLPVGTASWLLSGPDGPRLHRHGAGSVQLNQEDGERPAPPARPPIDVHVACYRERAGGPSVWLATVLAPGVTTTLLGWPRPWQDGSPLHHLVRLLLADTVPGPGRQDGLLGTLVLVPTGDAPVYAGQAAQLRMLDLFEDDRREVPGPADHPTGDLHGRLRRLPPGDGLLRDLTAALGHRLPWWPPGCATPDLVAAWTPGTTIRSPHVPPPLAEADAFRRRCQNAAAGLTGTLRASVQEVGRWVWDQASTSWLPDRLGAAGALPEACDPDVWQAAVEFTPVHRTGSTGDFWEGLEWVMEHASSQRLADDALRYLTDPASAATAVIDTETLPAPLRTSLTPCAAEPGGNHRARRVLEALDAHPGAAAADAVLGTWPAAAGPAWCATASGSRFVALHVPRSLPDPGTVGTPLEIVVAAADRSDRHSPEYLAFVTTGTDAVFLLPEVGAPAFLAAAIEHAEWHPGVRVLAVGLLPSSNRQLVAAVEALAAARPRITPWDRLGALVGPHPDESYCGYCQRIAEERLPGST